MKNFWYLKTVIPWGSGWWSSLFWRWSRLDVCENQCCTACRWSSYLNKLEACCLFHSSRDSLLASRVAALHVWKRRRGEAEIDEMWHCWLTAKVRGSKQAQLDFVQILKQAWKLSTTCPPSTTAWKPAIATPGQTCFIPYERSQIKVRKRTQFTGKIDDFSPIYTQCRPHAQIIYNFVHTYTSKGST